jgi:hypothetical protein
MNGPPSAFDLSQSKILDALQCVTDDDLALDRRFERFGRKRVDPSRVGGCDGTYGVQESSVREVFMSRGELDAGHDTRSMYHTRYLWNIGEEGVKAAFCQRDVPGMIFHEQMFQKD